MSPLSKAVQNLTSISVLRVVVATIAFGMGLTSPMLGVLFTTDGPSLEACYQLGGMDFPLNVGEARVAVLAVLQIIKERHNQGKYLFPPTLGSPWSGKLVKGHVFSSYKKMTEGLRK